MQKWFRLPPRFQTCLETQSARVKATYWMMDDNRMILDGVSDSEQPCITMFSLFVFQSLRYLRCSLPRNSEPKATPWLATWAESLSLAGAQGRNSNRMRHNCCRNWCITRFEKNSEFSVSICARSANPRLDRLRYFFQWVNFIWGHWSTRLVLSRFTHPRNCGES